MKIGLVGKPNVGKSTFFKAATLKDVAIADYPFTTIEPNHGIGYVRAPCPHVDFKVQCHPVHGACADGTRFVPVDLVDVAGLVPGAHQGRGLGNKFLDDLRQAHCLIHIVDATGSSNEEGQPVAPGSHDPRRDIEFLENEIDWWIQGILADDWLRIAKKSQSAGEKIEKLLAEKLTGLGLTEGMAHQALREAPVDLAKPLTWGEPGLLAVATSIRRISKPTLLVLNKADKAAPEKVKGFQGLLGARAAIPASADAEIALRGAAKANLIQYTPGGPSFEPVPGATLNPKQEQALEFIRTHVLAPYGSTGVLPALEEAAYRLLKLIVVFPVEDDHKLSDKKGNVLPDAHLIPLGTTARDFAYRIHTQIGEHFIRAIDVRHKRTIGADHLLQNGDVIRIIADV